MAQAGAAAASAAAPQFRVTGASRTDNGGIQLKGIGSDGQERGFVIAPDVAQHDLGIAPAPQDGAEGGGEGSASTTTSSVGTVPTTDAVPSDAALVEALNQDPAAVLRVAVENDGALD